MTKLQSKFLKVSKKGKFKDKYFTNIRDMCILMNEEIGEEIFKESHFYHKEKPPVDYEGYKIEYINITRK